MTPLVSSYEPRGDAVLILPLALVLSRLTSSPPWFNQNLQDLLDLIRPVMIGGCSLVPGPALVVPSICLYHGGDHQGGGGVPPCLLKSTKQQHFSISQLSRVSPFLRLHKMVGEIPTEPDLSLLIPWGGHHAGQIQSGSFCQLQCSWKIIWRGGLIENLQS